jgi:hypothetical protein
MVSYIGDSYNYDSINGVITIYGKLLYDHESIVFRNYPNGFFY